MTQIYSCRTLLLLPLFCLTLTQAGIAFGNNVPRDAKRIADNSTREPQTQRASIFTGSLLDADGHVMRRAHVHIEPLNESKAYDSVEVGRTGRFRIATKQRGLVGVRFTGVDHESRKIILLIDQPLQVKLVVKLNTYSYKDPLNEVKVIGDFNNFSSKGAITMERQPDGVYVAHVDTTANKLAYQLVGVTKTGETVNGTQSEDFTYDGGGDYRSIVTAHDGRVSITFDPQKLVRSTTASSIRFINPASYAARFFAIYEAMMSRREKFHLALVAYKQTGRPLTGFKYDWSRDSATLLAQLNKETQSGLRQAILIGYLDLGYGSYGAALDAGTARRALAEIAPNSPFWSIEPYLIGVAIDATKQPDEYAAFVADVIATNTDPNVVRIVRATLSPDRQIVVGKIVPSFSLPAIDEPQRFYAPDAFRGKTVLIDFWATWCVPCIEEMPNLHAEYQKFRNNGLEILSVSLDNDEQVVKRFREDKWPMPWLHALLKSSPDAKKQFEIVGIPKAVMIDRNGYIVAVDKALRGPRLHETLTNLLGPPH